MYEGLSMDRYKAIKKNKIPKNVSEYEYIQEEIQTFFPQSKYFQIHFQHCHENAEAIQQELQTLKKYVSNVEEKLERLMKSLDEQIKN